MGTPRIEVSSSSKIPGAKILSACLGEPDQTPVTI